MSEPRKFAGLDIPEGMTRSAFKKLVKQQKMAADHDEFMERRRAKRRQLRKQHPHRRPKLPTSQDPSGVNVVIDCGFDELMEDSERVSLAGQLTRCYSENRRCARPVNLAISNFNGKLKSRFDNEMHKTHELWSKIKFSDTDILPLNESTENCSDTFNKMAVYLTGDAEDVLDTLDAGCTYYIGGIVDRDRYTNLCLNKAASLGIRAARLPIDEHIRVSGRRVLTTNQAFELLLKWLELRDWKAAFEAAIPRRKLEKDVKVESGETNEDVESVEPVEDKNSDNK